MSGGIAVSDISNHFPTFAVIEIKADQKKKNDQNFTRDLNNFNVEAFLRELILPTLLLNTSTIWQICQRLYQDC